MATTLITPRDGELLQLLAWCPLTADQILAASRTFRQPFPSVRPLQRRLQLLCAAGWVRRARYAVYNRGALPYYVLSPAGWQLLHGPRQPLPHKRRFGDVSLLMQEHTRRLAEVLVHTLVAAHAAGLEARFQRSEELALHVGQETLIPDAGLQLVTREGRTFNFLWEIDNGTEPVVSARPRDNLLRKMALYEAWQQTTAERFRVLFFFRGAERRDHALRVAESLTRNPRRRLVYGVTLSDFLTAAAPLTAPLFRDHHGEVQSLIVSAKPPTRIDTLRSG